MVIIVYPDIWCVGCPGGGGGRGGGHLGIFWVGIFWDFIPRSRNGPIFYTPF